MVSWGKWLEGVCALADVTVCQQANVFFAIEAYFIQAMGVVVAWFMTIIKQKALYWSHIH